MKNPKKNLIEYIKLLTSAFDLDKYLLGHYKHTNTITAYDVYEEKLDLNKLRLYRLIKTIGENGIRKIYLWMNFNLPYYFVPMNRYIRIALRMTHISFTWDKETQKIEPAIGGCYGILSDVNEINILNNWDASSRLHRRWFEGGITHIAVVYPNEGIHLIDDPYWLTRENCATYLDYIKKDPDKYLSDPYLFEFITEGTIKP